MKIKFVLLFICLLNLIQLHAQCPDPSGLNTSNVGPTSAILLWTSGGVINWQIQYNTTGFSLGTGNIIETNTNPFTLSNLLPETSYEFYVRDSCGVGDFSNWVGPFSFITTELFTDINASLTSVYFGSASWGDYDNDGDLDILLTGGISKIYRNDGSNVFTDINAGLTGVDLSSASWGDYDNDGDLDILITGWDGSNAISKIYRNDGSNVFTDINAGLTGVDLSSASWGDYDNDGDMDILITGRGEGMYNRITKIYRNDGSNIFYDINVGLTGVYDGTAAVWGDYDIDGDLDILLTGNSSSGRITKIYRNDGNEIFTDINAGLTGVNYSSVAWGDYDNDGDLDILITGWDGSNAISKIYRNDGSDVFTDINAGLTGVDISSAAWGDYDNDGDLDILLTGSDGSNEISKIYRNDGVIFNTVPSAPSVLNSNLIGNNITFNWNKSVDNETLQDGLTYNISVGITPGGGEIISPMSDLTSFRKIPQIGNVNHNTNWTIDINRILPNDTVYWSVQAIDNAFAGGDFANEQICEISVVRADFYADTVCLHYETHFRDTTIITEGELTGWKWYFDDGDSSSVQHPTHTYLEAGVYNVQLTASSSELEHTVIKPVYVKHIPVADFIADIVCIGNPTTFVNTSNTGSVTVTEWFWDFGDDNTSFDENPAQYGYLNAQEYTVKLRITAENGCVDSILKTVIVADYPNAVISVTGSSEFCEGDSAILSVEYYPDYTYQWKNEFGNMTGATSNTITIKESGTYSLIITNSNACTVESPPINVIVSETPPKPTIEAGSDTHICPGESVELSVPYVPEYDYQWELDGFNITNDTGSTCSATEDGLYTVEISHNNCSISSDAIEITYKPALPKPDIFAQGPVIWYLACSNDTASDYRWYYNNELIPGANKYIYIANQNLGEYYVAINDGGECWVASDVITIPLGATSTTQPTSFGEIKIYPNPTPGMFTIEMDNQLYGELFIFICTQEGKEVYNIRFHKNTQHFIAQVDLNAQGSGLYIILLYLDKYKTERKLIIE